MLDVKIHLAIANKKPGSQRKCLTLLTLRFNVLLMHHSSLQRLETSITWSASSTDDALRIQTSVKHVGITQDTAVKYQAVFKM